MKMTTAARTIGWISIGLGATELVAPGWLQKKLGMDSYNRLTSIFGIREMLSGLGGGTSAAPATWSRMAGEAFNLVELASAAQRRMQNGGVGTALATVAALTAMDALVASGRAREADEDDSRKIGRKAEKAEPKARAATRQKSSRAISRKDTQH